MFELTALQTEEVSGGFSWGTVISVAKSGIQAGQAYVAAIGAAGQTLSNYYGPEMTIEIFAAGNMCA